MSTITILQLPNSGVLTGTEVLPIVQSDATVKTTVQDIANLAGLSGTNFIYVAADGTDTENATAISAAYTTAKTMLPSPTNRITIVAAPGYYNFGSTTFELDTAYIDLVSLDGNRSVIFNSSDALGTLWVTGNNIYLKGIDVQTKSLSVGHNLNNLVVENCKGGNDSFGFGGTISGTFINCTGGDNSFGSIATSSAPIGVLNNNSAANVSGTFTNCVGGDFSFGSSFLITGTVSGIFNNCIGGSFSFGYAALASGTFTNCTGGASSFGAQNSSAGIFSYCVGGPYSWSANMLGKLYFSRMTAGGQTAPIASNSGAIVAFITTADDFIAQDPL
jgi:hypothetical protein